MSGMMELISTDDHFIFHQLVQSEHALWVNRHTGKTTGLRNEAQHRFFATR